jgi:hypothetical protein
MLPMVFISLSLAVFAVLAWTSRDPRFIAGVSAWLALTAGLAGAGLLSDFASLPPPAPLLFVTGFIITILVARSAWAVGWLRLPVRFLVGFQAFRIGVELLIHEAVVQGIAPPQMTWSGLNLDILTGITALLLAPWAHRLPRAVLLGWNVIGLGLLAWVVGVATISFPTRFQILTPSNTWVAEFPYVWLPTVHVTAALVMHIVLFRRLHRDSQPC